MAAAKAELRAVNIELARHYMECSRCCFAKGDVLKYCDHGYGLAKGQTRASNRIRRLEDRERARPIQGVLW